MASGPDLLHEAQVIVAHYLDAEEQFEDAARSLAPIVRKWGSLPMADLQQSLDPPDRTLWLRKLSLAEWMDPKRSYRRDFDPLSLLVERIAPGRAQADLEKARALLDEALRLAETIGGDAA